MSRIVLFNKPFDVLCQFTDGGGRRTLADWIDVPGVYPAGRLDRDSEGLVVLTDDGALISRIADPRHKLPKTYLVQVEGIPDEADLARLCSGVLLNDGQTLPARARLIPAPDLWERHPPIRQRNNDVTSWIELVLREGRNRQVRRMTAAVGHPTLRLVRQAIGEWTLEGLAPGEFRVENVPGTPGRATARDGRRESPASGRKTTARSPASAPRGTGQTPSAPPSGTRRRRLSRASRKGRGS